MDISVDRVPGDITIKFDDECWQCDGTGRIKERNTTHVCDTCHGIGYQLTEHGRELATFIERYFHLVRKVITT